MTNIDQYTIETTWSTRLVEEIIMDSIKGKIPEDMETSIFNIIEDLNDGELLYAASWYRNYCRNKKLIDLAETPQDLKNEIIREFNSQDPWHNKGLVFPYLINKRCNQLIESVQEFIQ